MPRRTLPIRQLASGKWQARPAGMVPITRDTYEAAESECLRMLYERRNPEVVETPRVRQTFREYAETWLAGKPGTEASRGRIRSSLENHLYPIIGDEYLEDLSRDRLQAVVTNLRKKNGDPFSTSTSWVIIQHLNQVLNAAVANESLTRNRAKGIVPSVGRDPRQIIIPTPDQVAALAEVIDPRSRGLVAAGAGLGVRQGEAFGMIRPALDFLRKSVHIGTKVRYEKGKHHLDSYTKNRNVRSRRRDNNGHRDVPLSQPVANELTRHLEEFGTGMLDLLFLNPDGRMLYHRNWNRDVWWPAAKAVDLNATFHSLRHFYATSLLRNKVSVAAVSKVLGDQQSTVIKYYSHWIDDDTDTIIAVMEDVLAHEEKLSEAQ